MTTGRDFANADLLAHRRLRIEYFDQNDSFASQLPRHGTVEQELAFSDSAGPWYFVRLDAPVLYEEQSYSHLLLMSRCEGFQIGRQNETPVFMLLVPPGMVPKPDQSRTQFVHVAWGLVFTVTLILVQGWCALRIALSWQYVTL